MNNLVDLITSKAIQSKNDGRMATVIGVENDNVILDMERIGKRVFPIGLVQKGFVALLDNKSLIESFVKREVRTDLPMKDELVYKLSGDVWELMSRRFKDLTSKECYDTIRSMMPKG